MMRYNRHQYTHLHLLSLLVMISVLFSLSPCEEYGYSVMAFSTPSTSIPISTSKSTSSSLSSRQQHRIQSNMIRIGTSSRSSSSLHSYSYSSSYSQRMNTIRIFQFLSSRRNGNRFPTSSSCSSTRLLSTQNDSHASHAGSQSQSQNQSQNHPISKHKYQHQNQHQQSRYKKVKYPSNNNSNNNRHRRNNKRSRSPSDIQDRLRRASEVEYRLSLALDQLQEELNPISESKNTNTNTNIIMFPRVRDCNGALAIMGDTGDFKRALRLFGKMRKAVTLVSNYNEKHLTCTSSIFSTENDHVHVDDDDNDDNDNRIEVGVVAMKTGTEAGDENENEDEDEDENHNDQFDYNYQERKLIIPPSPTLVTYSTLMSRAVSLGKERVALRLWRLMISSPSFFANVNMDDNFDVNREGRDSGLGSSQSSGPGSGSGSGMDGGVYQAPIVPDIRAVNILMNVFAKSNDPVRAKMLMEQLYNGTVVRYDTSMEKNGMIASSTITSTSTSTSTASVDEGNEKDNTSSNEKENEIEKKKDHVYLVLEESDSKAEAEEEMAIRLIQVVPRIEPNIVTYNTLIDACHRAGDLDAGLETLRYMKEYTDIRPDATTYTSLISSVARRATRSSGKSDPDLAFDLFDEMVYKAKIRPNGMTYSALINVCGRCSRSDLALKGLRMMLREKAKRQRNKRMSDRNYREKSSTKERYSYTLANEVGAWTAAIDACGKAGRLESAIRLFKTMPTFNVQPNIYTCSALTNCLLKSNTENYLDETLNVLKFMKQEGMEPSEVMYTSLITCASQIAMRGNEERGELVLRDFGDTARRVNANTDEIHKEEENDDRMKALGVYTELILSLTGTSSSHNNNPVHAKPAKFGASTSDEFLVKVFLVLQEMKASGADPDIACYNAILRACAQAGDVGRLKDVLRRIELDGLIPNSNTWKQVLRGTSIARDSTSAETLWNKALNHQDDKLEDSYSNTKWVPKADDFDSLISSYIREAAKASAEKKRILYSKVVNAYAGVSNREERLGFSHIDVISLKEKPRVVKMVSQAATFLKGKHVHDIDNPLLQINICDIEKEFKIDAIK